MPETIEFNFKTPDMVRDVLQNEEGLDEDVVEELLKKLSKWFVHNEYVTVIYNTKTDEMTVRRRR